MVLDPRSRKPKEKRVGFFPLPFLIIFFIILVSKIFIEYDDEGVPQLATWRTEKLQKELDDLGEAEQYALKAIRPGYFPCYSCRVSGLDSSHIFLIANQIWRYGMTTKGQEGRYRDLARRNLYYEIQFTGTIGECLKEERRKIYEYAIHPENISREKPLIRPPGNKKYQ